MHELHDDRTAVGGLQPFNDFAERERTIDAVLGYEAAATGQQGGDRRVRAVEACDGGQSIEQFRVQNLPFPPAQVDIRRGRGGDRLELGCTTDADCCAHAGKGME